MRLKIEDGDLRRLQHAAKIPDDIARIAEKFFQPGGKYESLVEVDDYILPAGLIALDKELDTLKARLQAKEIELALVKAQLEAQKEVTEAHRNLSSSLVRQQLRLHRLDEC